MLTDDRLTRHSLHIGTAWKTSRIIIIYGFTSAAMNYFFSYSIVYSFKYLTTKNYLIRPRFKKVIAKIKIMQFILLETYRYIHKTKLYTDAYLHNKTFLQLVQSTEYLSG